MAELTSPSGDCRRTAVSIFSWKAGRSTWGFRSCPAVWRKGRGPCHRSPQDLTHLESLGSASTTSAVQTGHRGAHASSWHRPDRLRQEDHSVCGPEELNRRRVNICTGGRPRRVHINGLTSFRSATRPVQFLHAFAACCGRTPPTSSCRRDSGMPTANIAVQPPGPGHLVLRRLHTNDAPGAYPPDRSGRAPYLVSASLIAVWPSGCPEDLSKLQTGIRTPHQYPASRGEMAQCPRQILSRYGAEMPQYRLPGPASRSRIVCPVRRDSRYVAQNVTLNQLPRPL